MQGIGYDKEPKKKKKQSEAADEGSGRSKRQDRDGERMFRRFPTISHCRRALGHQQKTAGRKYDGLYVKVAKREHTSQRIEQVRVYTSSHADELCGTRF